MRAEPYIRALTQEHHITSENLVYPLFILDQPKGQDAISAMPGLARLGFDEVYRTAEKCLELGIPAIALFPVLPAHLKSENGDSALDPDGVLPRILQGLKSRFPSLGLCVDIALDPYTSHGHDGCLDEKGRVDNDKTLARLCQQALLYSQAGADIVAPSDMMDGRIQAIRHTLDENQEIHTLILSYAAKYASCFYGPFRNALGSEGCLRGDKKTYQMNPANLREALLEVALDAAEGADMLMVKPGMPYLDVISHVAAQSPIPTFAYQVSGEYAMIVAASANGWLDLRAAVLESLLGFKRAGCQGIFTYFALEAAQWLRESR